MTLSCSQYHCSSLWRPALHRLPHFLSSVSMDRLPCRPTVHSRQRASTDLTAQHIRYFGGSSRSCSCCCCRLGERASGVATILAWAEAYLLAGGIEGKVSDSGSSCCCC